MTFETPSWEVWIDASDLSEFGCRVARETREAVPDAANRGLCVGIYDRTGEAVSYVPLDTLH
jgi:hypothetical protein